MLTLPNDIHHSNGSKDKSSTAAVDTTPSAVHADQSLYHLTKHPSSTWYLVSAGWTLCYEKTGFQLSGTALCAHDCRQKDPQNPYIPASESGVMLSPYLSSKWCVLSQRRNILILEVENWSTADGTRTCFVFPDFLCYCSLDTLKQVVCISNREQSNVSLWLSTRWIQSQPTQLPKVKILDHFTIWPFDLPQRSAS